jgi:DNA-binding transcriptional MerR regulator
MKGKEIFSISDFARFARTTRDTLLHYDRLGLLSPVARGENNYRYYSNAQLTMVNLIRTLQQLGMPLSEIKRLKDRRTPDLVVAVLENQMQKIDDEIERWVRARKLLGHLSNTIRAGLGANTARFSIAHHPAEAIVLGELNDYAGGRDFYDALLSFYYKCSEKYPNMDLNYPVWAVYSEERVRERDWARPDRYYFHNPEGYDKKPAALYATGCARGRYDRDHGLFDRLSEYIEENGYEICGPAYEEYPHNEICVADGEDYLVRLMVTVTPAARSTRRTG